MEKVIKTFENLGLTIRKYNTNANNPGKYHQIVDDILKKHNKVIFYILDSKFIKHIISNKHYDENDNCMIMFNFHGDNDNSFIVFNYNNNYQIKNIEEQFIFMLKNKPNIECCICFEKGYMKCSDCINYICLDCLNKMKNNNQFITCPCCREEWYI